MKGKLHSLIGFRGVIETASGERYSFDQQYATDDLKVGDYVSFEIEETLFDDGEESSPEVVQVSRRVEDTIRLSQLARKLNVGRSAIVETLEQVFDREIDPSPNSRILESDVKRLQVFFAHTPKVDSSLSLLPGSRVQATVLQKIEPGILVMDIGADLFATISIHDLAWTLPNAERLFIDIEVGQELEVFLLEWSEAHEHYRLSLKETFPRTHHARAWRELKLATPVRIEVREIFPEFTLVGLPNNLLGIVPGLADASESYMVADKSAPSGLVVVIKGKGLPTSKTKKKPAANLLAPNRRYLESWEAFKLSRYFKLLSGEEQILMADAYKEVNGLFSSEFDAKYPLYLDFSRNRPAWEELTSQVLPALFKDVKPKSEQDYLDKLLKERYWISRTDYETDGFPRLMVFNNKLSFTCNIIKSDGYAWARISTIKVTQTDEKDSNNQKWEMKKGTFLLHSKIDFIPFGSSFLPDQLENQLKVLNELKAKSKANILLEDKHKILNSIRQSEGKSLEIHASFLAFQESYIRKQAPDPKPLPSNNLNRVPGAGDKIAFQLPREVTDIFQESDVKELCQIMVKDDDDYRSLSDAFCILTNAQWAVSPRESKVFDTKENLYLRKKVSTGHLNQQHSILSEYMAGTLDLKAIDEMLISHEDLKLPDQPEVNFINPLLTLTSQDQSDNHQVRAVVEAIGNRNIYIIQGPPGTGKTTVISEVVAQLRAKGERILVASQTHVAVDNVLEKLDKQEGVIRLGAEERISDRVKKMHPSQLVKAYEKDLVLFLEIQEEVVTGFIEQVSVEVLKDLIKEKSIGYGQLLGENLRNKNFEFLHMMNEGVFEMPAIILSLIQSWKEDVSTGLSAIIEPLVFKSARVIGATCLGIRMNRAFRDYEYKFDTVIIDEAGKANIAESLVAISMGKKILLVGDEKQLPPYLDGELLDPENKDSFLSSTDGKNFEEKSIKKALETSFMELVLDRMAHGKFPVENKVMLNYQYRMHPAIGRFISDTFYEGKVNMGKNTHTNTISMDPPFDKELIFFDTSNFKNPYEEPDGVSYKNTTEALLISELIVPNMMDAVSAGETMAIVAPYKSQVRHIRNTLGESLLPGCEVSTLDSFQGMEFDIIIFSFTRSASPDQKKKGVGFLDDARRLNVALSRAKKKLILVGNTKTLTDRRSHYDTILFNYTRMFKRLVKACENGEHSSLLNAAKLQNEPLGFADFARQNPVGTLLKGTVKTVLINRSTNHEYGLIISVGNIEGLVYYTDIYPRVQGLLSSSFELGQKVEVWVYKIDPEKEQVAFTIGKNPPKPVQRRTEYTNPSKKEWTKTKLDFPEGAMLRVAVKKVFEYGIIASVNNQLNGWISINELSRNIKVDYKKGNELEVTVIGHNEQAYQLRLSESRLSQSMARLKNKKF